MFKTDLLNDQGNSLFLVILFGMAVAVVGVVGAYHLAFGEEVPAKQVEMQARK